MRLHSDGARRLGLGALILLAVNAPYLLAWALPGPTVFGGVLMALQDGYSYLAKMREGWRGEWLFTLPYTAEPGPGVFLYTYYLFLGHVARWTGGSLEAAYHLARVANGALFLAAADHLMARFLLEPGTRLGPWLFFSLSSGLGWLALPFAPLPPDLTITESIPFLSLFVNAHFPLAWALMLWLFALALAEPATPGALAQMALATTLLGLVHAMALAPAGLVVGGVAAWRAIGARRYAPLRPALVVGVCAAPWVAHALWVVNTHPVLRLWNAQNVTLAPGLPEALLWGGLPLLLALPGMWNAARRRSPEDMILLIWLGLGLALVYAPITLQRRMSTGLWFPLCLLAVQGWREVLAPRLPAAWRGRLAVLGGGASVISNLLVWIAALAVVMARRPDVFLARAEVEAFAALPAEALVLAAPETGMFIPARSDARVLYGHQYETVDAERQKQAVEAFYAGRTPAGPFLDERGVDLVFYGPREAALGPRPDLSGWRVFFQNDGVTVYER